MEVLNWVFFCNCCSTAVGPCDNKPCLNGGVCTANRNDSYTCKCASGYSGGNCEIGTWVTTVSSANSHFHVRLCFLLDIFLGLHEQADVLYSIQRGNHRIWISYHHFLTCAYNEYFCHPEQIPDLMSNTTIMQTKEWKYLIYGFLLLRSGPMR